MGWTGVFINKQDIAQHIKDIWTSNTDNRFEVVSQIAYGNTFYQAVRDNDNDTVFAVVVLTSYKDGELVYKEISEDMGPGQYAGVTMKFLNTLTDTDNEYANVWRDKAKQWINHNKWVKKNLKSGATVTVSDEVHYAGYEPMTEFKVYNVAMKSLHAKLPGGFWGKLPRGWKNTITAINGEQAPAA